MTLIILLVLAGPIITALGQLVGTAIGFSVALVFHGLRGLGRRVLLPGLRRLFKKKEVYVPAR
jgi:hypothetical protein